MESNDGASCERSLLPSSSLHPLEVRFPGVVFVQPHVIQVGQRVSIDRDVRIVAGVSIWIGDDTMIASRVTISTNTHDYSNNPMWRTCISRPIAIGSNVWIGTGAIILPGVRVGDGAVVGAGSIVTRHVPPGAVVAGNPARIIRRLGLTTRDPTAVFPGRGMGMDFLADDQVCRERDEIGFIRREIECLQDRLTNALAQLKAIEGERLLEETGRVQDGPDDKEGGV